MKKITCTRPATRSFFVAALGLALSLLSGLSTAHGQLFFSDSFKYPLGTFVHIGPPPGGTTRQTAWTTNLGRPEITEGTLVYPVVASTGEKLTLEGATSDEVFALLPPVNSGVVWVSYLLELSSGSPDGYANLVFASAIPGPRFGLINGTGVYGISNEFGADRANLTTVAPGPTPDWLVLKLDFEAGLQTLYVNPTRLSGGQPVGAEGTARLRMTAEFQRDGFQEILLATGLNTAVFQFDEVRVGPTLGEVRTGR